MSFNTTRSFRRWPLAFLLVCTALVAACNDSVDNTKASSVASGVTVTATPMNAPAITVADTASTQMDALAARGTDGVADTNASAALANAISGTVEPQQRALLRAELSGAVRTLTVKVGERVRAGMVLAVLDVPAVRVAMAAADAQLRAQEVAMRQAQRERERVSQLLAVGGASRAELDDWEAKWQAAQAAVESARAQRASAAADVARLTVRAPFAGVVERRAITQGSVVQAGDELVSIIDARTLELEASIAYASATTVRPGTRVSLRVAGSSDSAVTARVVRVAPALDPVTRQRRITIEVPNRDGRIPAGAWVEGTVITEGGAR